MNKPAKYNLIIMSILFINICKAQNTIDELETYLFWEIFKPNSGVNEFIELNEKGDTTRYWKFDQTGRLINEIDSRISSWSSYIGDYSTNTSTTSKKEIIYMFNDKGQLGNFTEIKVIDNEISRTIHEFKYPCSDTIIESYKVINDIINMDIEKIEIREKAFKQQELLTMKNHVGSNYVQTVQRILYNYGENNILTNRSQYFTIISNLANEIANFDSEQLGTSTNYIYDERERIKNINEVEYDEEGLPQLRKNIEFIYTTNSHRIKLVNVVYGENYNPKRLRYEINYKNSGDLESIKINNTTFSYIIN